MNDHDPTIQDHADRASDDPSYEQGCFVWALAILFALFVGGVVVVMYLSNP